NNHLDRFARPNNFDYRSGFDRCNPSTKERLDFHVTIGLQLLQSLADWDRTYPQLIRKIIDDEAGAGGQFAAEDGFSQCLFHEILFAANRGCYWPHLSGVRSDG